MERKDFLKGLGVIGIGSVLPLKKANAAIGSMNSILHPEGACILIPGETEGPYVFDLSGNATMFRQDIREGNPGTSVNLTLTVVNVNDNCNPIPNARVDIWHCNKDGYYSEFANQPGYLGTQSHVGETFFRGIQLTDASGQVQFITVYPGWYPGRVTHIHFQVFLNSVLKATSQAAFPDSLTTQVYNTSLYSAHGQNSTTNSNDGVFSDSANTQYELLTISDNGSGGYDASLTIGIAVPVTGVINLEPETGGQFKLKQNYPNPFQDETVIPFSLTNPSQVKIEIFDLQGRKVMDLLNEKMSSGEQKAELNRKSNAIKLATGSYIYQLTVENENGIFRQCKSLMID
jgi:protocatechuate 3,4-dioxygenase beta subunit